MHFAALSTNVWLEVEYESADWTIILNSTQAFRVNSKIVARCSRYFYKEFASAISKAEPGPSPESRQTAVSYPEQDDFRDLLAYIHYTGEHPVDERTSVETSESEVDNEEFLVSHLLDAERLKRRIIIAYHFEVPFLIDAIVSTAIKMLSPVSCWMVMATAADPDCACKLLEFVAKEFILEHFVVATNWPQFLSLCTGEQLCELIDSNYLNVLAEFDIFNIVCKWIEADIADRKRYFWDLIRRLRHFVISEDQLQEIYSHPLSSEAECKSLVTLFRQKVDRKNFIQKCRIPHKAVFLCGGRRVGMNWRSSVTKGVQIFDPVLSEVVVHENFLPEMNNHTWKAVCVELDNRVYVIGGKFISERDRSVVDSNEVQAFCLRLRIWRQQCFTAVPRVDACGCVCDGFIYVIGGREDGRCNTAEQYDPANNSWRYIQSLQEPRTEAGAASLDGKVFVCGGINRCSMERYDPQYNQWTLLSTRLPLELAGFAMVAFNESLFALGGYNSTYRAFQREVYCYSASEPIWCAKPPLLSRCRYHSATVLNNHIYVFGGEVRKDLNSEINEEMSQAIQRWNSSQLSWTVCSGRLANPMDSMGCCTISGCDFIEPLLNRW